MATQIPSIELESGHQDLLENQENVFSNSKAYENCNEKHDEERRDWKMQSPSPVVHQKCKRKLQEEGLLVNLCSWIVNHQLGLSINLLLLLIMTHLSFPRARRHTRKFYDLSYFNTDTGRYGLGWDDLCMVFFWIVAFTGLRVAVMEYALVVIAQKAQIQKRKDCVRFAEQAWVFFYYGAFWSLGMYIYYNSDYWLNMTNMWRNWPDREMDGLFKWYYLVQFAFWLQQIFIVHIEERRKDHWQMFTHHLITCSLMLASYGYHQTKAGNLILCIMDSVDTIFPLAKMLKYLNHTTACDVMFGVFMIVWFITRHIFFPLVIYEMYSNLPRTISYGCYSGSNANLTGPLPVPDRVAHLVMPFRDPEGLVCYHQTTNVTFIALLLSLQVVLLVWFAMIMRLALKVLSGGEAQDPRSDDEADESENDLAEPTEHGSHMPDAKSIAEDDAQPLPLEIEVGVEDIALGGRISGAGKRFRKGGAASGVTLPSDRKELLGRIGCDKGS